MPETGFVLLAIGVIAWLGGAKFTTDGAVKGINFFSDWFGAPIHVPTVSGWWLWSIVIVGFFFSRVEIKRTPFRQVGDALVFTGVGMLLSWLFISGVDFITTYIGLADVTAESWQIHRQLAGNQPALVLSSVLLTYAPEFMILAGLYFTGVTWPMGWFSRK
jgi:hypothetical protein